MKSKIDLGIVIWMGFVGISCFFCGYYLGESSYNDSELIECELVSAFSSVGISKHKGWSVVECCGQRVEVPGILGSDYGSTVWVRKDVLVRNGLVDTRGKMGE